MVEEEGFDLEAIGFGGSEDEVAGGGVLDEGGHSHTILSALVTICHRTNYSDIFSCLKFFDWASRQLHFHHTHATVAIFYVLSRANLVLDFRHTFRKHVISHMVYFNNTLVIGYAIAKKTRRHPPHV